MAVPALHPRTVTLNRHPNGPICVVGYVEGIAGWENLECNVGEPGGSNAIAFPRNKCCLPSMRFVIGRKGYEWGCLCMRQLRYGTVTGIRGRETLSTHVGI